MAQFIGGWSASGKLTSGQAAVAVILQASFTASPKGVQNYTVQFSIVPPVHVGGGQPNWYNPEAEIVWSVAGNSVRRLVSVTDGLAITGQAEACRVRLYDAMVGGFGTNRPYVGNINIAPGSRASYTAGPTLLAPGYANEYNIPAVNYSGVITIPASGYVRVPTPKNAGVMSVFSRIWDDSPANATLTSANAYIEHHNNAGLAMKRYFPNTEAYVPLAAGNDTLLIFNRTALSLRANVTYGIDG